MATNGLNNVEMEVAKAFYACSGKMGTFHPLLEQILCDIYLPTAQRLDMQKYGKAGTRLRSKWGFPVSGQVVYNGRASDLMVIFSGDYTFDWKYTEDITITDCQQMDMAKFGKFGTIDKGTSPIYSNVVVGQQITVTYSVGQPQFIVTFVGDYTIGALWITPFCL